MVIKIVFKLLFNILPIFLMAIGRFEKFAKLSCSVLCVNPKEESLDKFMVGSFIAGVLMIYVYYPIRFEYFRYKLKRKNEKLKEVAKELRNIFSKSLGREVKYRKLMLNVRRYKPKSFYKKKFRDWLAIEKKYFEMIDYDFLNDSAATESRISFQVHPTQRGLVGVAYARKNIVYDDKLTLEERKKKYNLSNKHKTDNVIANTDFAIAKPIINDYNRVKSIITFDTEQDVEIPIEKKEEVNKLILYYSDIFSKILTNIN